MGTKVVMENSKQALSKTTPFEINDNTITIHFGDGSSQDISLPTSAIETEDAVIDTNGYIKFSNGLIIQWGYKTLSDTNGTVNIYNIPFPISFPNACLNVQVTSRESSDLDNNQQYFYALTVSSTRMYKDSFDMRILDDSGSSSDVGVNFIAIGY